LTSKLPSTIYIDMIRAHIIVWIYHSAELGPTQKRLCWDNPWHWEIESNSIWKNNKTYTTIYVYICVRVRNYICIYIHIWLDKLWIMFNSSPALMNAILG
jgi:hypothetical protein